MRIFRGAGRWAIVVATAMLVADLRSDAGSISAVSDPIARALFRQIQALPVVREERYQLNVRIRLVPLVWIAHENVGEAQVTWRHSPGVQAIELLVGTVPDRTPRRINRWGYVADLVRGATTTSLGLMNAANDEATVAGAQRAVGKAASEGRYRAVTTTASLRTSSSLTTVRAAPASWTFQDLALAVDLLSTAPAEARSIDVPDHRHDGFLTALDTLLHRSAALCFDPPAPGHVNVLPYVYGSTTYELRLLTCARSEPVTVGQGRSPDTVTSTFRILNRATRHATEFGIASESSGEWRGRPVRVWFRPRSWMELELTPMP